MASPNICFPGHEHKRGVRACGASRGKRCPNKLTEIRRAIDLLPEQSVHVAAPFLISIITCAPSGHAQAYEFKGVSCAMHRGTDSSGQLRRANGKRSPREATEHPLQARLVHRRALPAPFLQEGIPIERTLPAHVLPAMLLDVLVVRDIDMGWAAPLAIWRHKPEVARRQVLPCDQVRDAGRGTKGLDKRTMALLAHMVPRLKMLGLHADVVDREPIAIFAASYGMHPWLHVHQHPQQRPRVDIPQLALPNVLFVLAVLKEPEGANRHELILRQILDWETSHILALAADREQGRLARGISDDVVGNEAFLSQLLRQ
mmetsp:Transcript_102788/g.257860  ORF Transcript_102788/g.257860 Transcript_102788/m.257860 type:complete len:316 (-) Transcript_102788:200-1147(-)